MGDAVIHPADICCPPTMNQAVLSLQEAPAGLLLSSSFGLFPGGRASGIEGINLFAASQSFLV